MNPAKVNMNASSSTSTDPGPEPRGTAVPEAPSASTSNDVRRPSPPPNARLKRTAIVLQDACLKHRFIRSRDVSGIFERPERLRAVKLGLAAAIARIEDAKDGVKHMADEDEGELTAALARMAIASVPSSSTTSSESDQLRTASLAIRRTCARVSLLDHPAVKYVHGDIDGDVYLEHLVEWARESQKNIAKKGTEIPEGVPPLDLYLCPGSIDAIEGAIGAVCEAVDASVAATRGLTCPVDDPCERAFVAIRPPGHHCGEDTPSGFCFINNVAVAAAHAHLNHSIQRIVIFDIDLHHGNGTQSIVWQINEETYRQTLEAELPEPDAPPQEPGPRIYYGSLHDILSFPCEDGKPEIIQAGSTSIHGPHGQYIENIHLQKYESEAHFWDALYPKYLALLHRARDFLDETGGPGDDVIVFISCGFDAGEHEYPSMSRHNRGVPVGFYHRFTRETCAFADTYACGRVVSVLEGGYSDRALTSGALAHLCGLVDVCVDEGWWSVGNLVQLEKACKPRKAAAARTSMEGWLARAVSLLALLDGADGGAKRPVRGASSVGPASPPPSMTLRERKKPVFEGSDARPRKNASRSVSGAGKPPSERTSKRVPSVGISVREPDEQADPPSGTENVKKLPRVILRVRPPDSAG